MIFTYYITLQEISKPEKQVKQDTTIYTGLFNDSFLPVIDGVAITVENYARWLPQHGFNPMVITPWNKVKTQMSYPVERYLSIPIIGRSPYRLGLEMLDPTIHRRMRNTRFQILHAHSPFSSGQIALKVARSQKVPLIATFHSKFKADLQRSFLGQSWLVDHIIRKVITFLNKCDQVWIPQAEVETTIREYGYRGPLTVVPNGNDMIHLTAEEIPANKLRAKAELDIDPNIICLLFVGQHIKEKGLPLILHTLKVLHQHNIQYSMHFIGTGYASEWLRSEVNKMNLAPYVTLHGSITDRAMLADYYAAADLFFFPSKYDNAPLVVREAAAMGTPSILLKGSTAAEVVTDGTNAFLCTKDPDMCADLIADIAADRHKLLQTGLNSASTLNRSWQDIIGTVADLYNKAITDYKH